MVERTQRRLSQCFWWSIANSMGNRHGYQTISILSATVNRAQISLLLIYVAVASPECLLAFCSVTIVICHQRRGNVTQYLRISRFAISSVIPSHYTHLPSFERRELVGSGQASEEKVR